MACGRLALCENVSPFSPDSRMINDLCQKLLEDLGVPDSYAERGLPAYEEAEKLVEVGPNLVGRMQRLAPRAAKRWQKMRESSAEEGINLMLVSGFRSYEYQAELIRNKLARGQTIDTILEVSAAPGYSQHHTGLAIDVATPGSRPLTEEFEHSDAFGWLCEHANRFGFSMTYPRNNPFGIAYEPWHWSL